MKKNMDQRLARLLERGFDWSHVEDDTIEVRCSQCEALCVNNTACHEQGCPNQTHECADECSSPEEERC